MLEHARSDLIAYDMLLVKRWIAKNQVGRIRLKIRHPIADAEYRLPLCPQSTMEIFLGGSHGHKGLIDKVNGRLRIAYSRHQADYAIAAAQINNIARFGLDGQVLQKKTRTDVEAIAQNTLA